MTTSESKGRFLYKTNRFESIRTTNRIESIRIANWNALLCGLSSATWGCRAHLSFRNLETTARKCLVTWTPDHTSPTICCYLPGFILHLHQLILLGDPGTKVWTTCPGLLCSSALAEVEPASSRSLVRHSPAPPSCHQQTGVESTVTRVGH